MMQYKIGLLLPINSVVIIKSIGTDYMSPFIYKWSTLMFHYQKNYFKIDLKQDLKN